MPASLSHLMSQCLGGVSSNSRRGPLALVASLCIHLAIMAALLMHWSSGPFGVAGIDLGTGVQVALVEGFSAGGAATGDVAQLVPEAERERPKERVEEVTPAGGMAQLIPAAAVQIPQEATQEKRSASVDLGERGEEAADNEGARGAADSRGGDPLATDLLNQIARCLPPTERPALMFSQLTLTIGGDGRLRAAPEVRSALPRLTQAERLAADHVVQAALQCGPYNKPGLAGRVISLAADFSSIQPVAVRGRKKGA